MNPLFISIIKAPGTGLPLETIFFIFLIILFLAGYTLYTYQKPLYNKWVNGHLKLSNIEIWIVIAFLPLQQLLIEEIGDIHVIYELYIALPMLIWIIEPFNGNNFPTYHSKTTKILVYLKIAIVFVTLLTLIFIGMLQYL